MLWKAVVSSKLLAKTSIILFLNKYDLLEQKLLSGVRIRDYVHSYGDRPNDVEHALKCELLADCLALWAHPDMNSPVPDRLPTTFPRHLTEELP